VLLVVGCGGDGAGAAPAGSGGAGATAGPAGPGGGAPGGGGPGGSAGGGGDEGWETLIDSSWTLARESEGYWCARKTVSEEIWVGAFRALAPPGTHHTVVTVEDATGPDDTGPCGPGSLGPDMLFASGVGTDDLSFPEGVAVKVPAGKQILLNLHLFNTTPEEMKGVSGTLVRKRTPSASLKEAELVLAGTLAVLLPPNQETTLSGSCAFGGDATVVTVWPHMHQLGTHQKVVHHAAAGEAVWHDAAFSFAEQTNYPIPSSVVKAGESVEVLCTWKNTHPTLVTFGDSSTQEMCFAGLYRYPALQDGKFCTN
jgi:hypothetical protein